MLKNHKTFFEAYHQGMANILLHLLGFSLWGYGIGSRNLVMIIIAPVIFESGHLYNYITGNRTKSNKIIIPVQLFTGLSLSFSVSF